MTEKITTRVLNEERRKLIRQALDAAQRSVETIRALDIKLAQMNEAELEETVETCDSHRDEAWIIQTKAIIILAAKRKKLPGGRGRKAPEGEGMEAFYEEWAEKLGRSKSWIRTNIQILTAHGEWSHWPSPDSEGKQAHTYYGSEVTIDDDEMFLEVRGDSGRTITIARFEPAPGLRRAHYEATLRSSNPRAAADWARDEILAGRECSAKRLAQHIRVEEMQLQREEARASQHKLNEWVAYDTKTLLAQLVRETGNSPAEILQRGLVLVAEQIGFSQIAA